MNLQVYSLDSLFAIRDCLNWLMVGNNTADQIADLSIAADIAIDAEAQEEAAFWRGRKQS